MKFLPAIDSAETKRYSSIYQHNNKLAVFKNNTWKPIVFDSIDGITCKYGVRTHPVVLALKDDIGYTFPVGKDVFFTDKYIYRDHNETVLKVLPKWYGEGYYKDYVERDSFTQADNGLLAERNKYKLRVGLDYVLADVTLPPAETDE